MVNCLFRISSKGAAREDEIVSGHVIDHELALLARIERQPFEDFNHPADLHAFGQKARERCALLGDGFVGSCDHLEFPRGISRSGWRIAYAADRISGFVDLLPICYPGEFTGSAK